MSLFRLTFRLVSSTPSPLHKNSSTIKSISSTALFLGVSGGNGLNTNKAGYASAAFLNQIPHSQQKQQNRNFSSLQSQMHQQKIIQQNNMAHRVIDQRTLFTKEITKNLTLIADKPRNLDFDPKTLRLKETSEHPLVLMMSWMLARKKHLLKYAKIYTDLGFDVLTVEVSPWQLLWPIKGSQVVAADALKFLENNAHYSPIVVHGFSVGGYQIGEMMVQMARDMNRYQPILDRIISQIWDSAADITEIAVGVPKAIFPRNQTLQNALRNYTLYHLKTFHNQATIHYMRSSQMFHYTLVKAPAIFFVSNNDPVGSVPSNWSVKEDWESAGIKTTWKCWDRSEHVSHFIRHPDEYLALLFKHLEDTNVMESIAKKSRAKL